LVNSVRDAAVLNGTAAARAATTAAVLTLAASSEVHRFTGRGVGAIVVIIVHAVTVGVGASASAPAVVIGATVVVGIVGRVGVIGWTGVVVVGHAVTVGVVLAATAAAAAVLRIRATILINLSTWSGSGAEVPIVGYPVAILVGFSPTPTIVNRARPTGGVAHGANVSAHFHAAGHGDVLVDQGQGVLRVTRLARFLVNRGHLGAHHVHAERGFANE